MPRPIDQFIAALTDSGLLSGAEISAVSDRASDAFESAAALADHLVQTGKLTSFQAEMLLTGGGPPLVLGNYELVNRIGAGGMGQVFKARHRRMERFVALKVLPAAATGSPELIQRFHREVKAVARLSHPHIVTAHDADEAKGVHFLVMEYTAGTDLSRLVRHNGPLPPAVAVDCIRQAARGLEYAHSKGVIHRDVKPSNLLLDSEGVVKVLDLGLARIDAADHDLHTELTGTGSMMGTIDYMSPEQALDTKHADARADIYSLGATLHYLVTGRPILPGDTRGKKMQALLSNSDSRPPSLRASAVKFPRNWIAFIKRWLNANRRIAMRPCRTSLSIWSSYSLRADPIAAATSVRRKSVSSSSDAGSPSSDSDLQRFLAGLNLPTTALAEPPEIEVSPETAASKATDQTDVRPTPGSTKPVTATALVTPLWRRLRIMTVLLLCGLLAAVIVAIKTRGGRLSIELPEAGDYRVLVDGEEAEIVNRDGRVLTVHVVPGSHRIVVETPDGLRLETDADKDGISMAWGGSGRIRAWFEARQDAVPPSLEAASGKTAASPPPAADWLPGPDEDVLLGLVRRPMILPGVRRWQMETVHARAGVGAVDWSPDGD